MKFKNYKRIILRAYISKAVVCDENSSEKKTHFWMHFWEKYCQYAKEAFHLRNEKNEQDKLRNFREKI